MRLDRFPHPLARQQEPIAVGTRVELHPATDAWMSGDKFGVVVAHGPRRKIELTGLVKVGRVHVKMDVSGKIRVLHWQNVAEAD